MRRYFILAFLLLLSLPFDIAIVGCGTANNFCSAGFGLKNNAIATINLEPKLTGVSLSFAQTGQINTPTASNCKQGSVSVGSFTYGTSDMTIADISPTGAVCAGTWNRFTAGGVPSFTTCLPTNKTGVAYLTASAGGVSSNTVAAYIHPTVTNVSLDVTGAQAGQAGQQAAAPSSCASQGNTAQLNATAFVEGSANPFCAPNSGNPSIPDCTTNLGHFTYAPASTGVVTIDQNGLATAQQPGSTVITAAIASTSSNAGYFYTCPPKNIALSYNNQTTFNVTPNTPLPLTATVTDTNGKSITGLQLSYTSTSPQTIAVAATGSITSSFPSSTAIYAVCQPALCNPSPINQLGVNGNGTPIVSNSVKVTSPGNGSTYLWLASPLSPYFVPVDLTTGTTGTPVKLPYVPNSMVLDQTGSNLYFGNYRELMIYNAGTNALTKEDTTVPGVVLAVSPTNSQVLINDQDRGVFYLYTPAVGGTASGGTTSTASILSTFGGIGERASYSPDGNTVYIVGKNVLYVHNNFTGWSVEPLTGSANPSATCPANSGSGNTASDLNTSYNVFCAPDLSLAVPAVGTFISGNSGAAAGATARGFCPDTTGANVDNYPSAVPGGGAGVYGFAADHLAATNDGLHVISATAIPPVLTDAAVVTPTGACPTTPVTTAGVVTNKSVGLQIPNSGNVPLSLAPYAPTNIDQVIASPDSSIAFVTYYSPATTPPAAGAQLPVSKIPQGSTAGGLSSVTLSGAAIAPLSGIFSPDYKTFFVSTTGDNLVHLISTATLTDTLQLNPKLTDASGNPTPAQLLAVKPRATN
ncbi:MAG: hypothetical protein ACR2JE_09005 [Acidobacteriaceae bacterium]